MKLTDISTIRSLLGEGQTSFKKKYGQNFLINDKIVRSIAESSVPDGVDPKECGILEIGPGIGVLTIELCDIAAKVAAIEIDSSLIPILGKTLEGIDNLTVINADVMKVDLQEIVRTHLSGCAHIAVAANLPYYITTPIITNLLESKLPFESITVMVQKEVADRLCSLPGSDSYGAVTASVSYYAKVTRIMNVSAGNFVPAPKVDSTVIKFIPYKEPPVSVIDERTFFSVIRASFGQRRKTLSNALAPAFSHIPKARIAQIISEAGFDPRVRGEEVGIDGFARIADLLYAQNRQSNP